MFKIIESASREKRARAEIHDGLVDEVRGFGMDVLGKIFEILFTTIVIMLFSCHY